MPRLWSQSIEEHRHAVRDGVLDATAGLVHERGITGVTMSAVAESAGVGRATLYKYFPDIESVLIAWHRREAAAHLAELARVRDAAPSRRRLHDVMSQYARGLRARAHGEPAAWLHRDAALEGAHSELRGLLGELIAEEAAIGAIRNDISPLELADYCLNALAAARAAASAAAVERVVEVTQDALRQPAPRATRSAMRNFAAQTPETAVQGHDVS